MLKSLFITLILSSSVFGNISSFYQGDINGDDSVDAADAAVLFEFWGSNPMATVIDRTCFSQHPANPELCRQFQVNLFTLFPNGTPRDVVPSGFPANFRGKFTSYVDGSMSTMVASYQGVESWGTTVDWSVPIDSAWVVFYNVSYTGLGKNVFTTVADVNKDLWTDSADAEVLFANWTGDTHPVPEPTGILFEVLLLLKRGKK